MDKDFEVMGLMIYFGYIQLVEGGYNDLKAFEKNRDLKNIFNEFHNLDMYKDIQISKLASRSFLALRGCYRKKKLSSDEVYKKLKLVANKIGTDHLQFCINATISLYYPDKRIPQNAFEEIIIINERIGMDIDFNFKYLAIEDISKINRIKAKAKAVKVKEKTGITDQGTRNVILLGGGFLIVAAIIFFFIM